MVNCARGRERGERGVGRRVRHVRRTCDGQSLTSSRICNGRVRIRHVVTANET